MIRTTFGLLSIPRIDHAVMDSYLSQLSANNVLRSRADSIVARIVTPHVATGTAIVKLWKRRGVRSMLRRISNTSPCHREVHARVRLTRSGVPVPQVFGFCRLAGTCEFSDAILIEDLGSCQTALSYVKTLLSEGAHREIQAFDHCVIEMTAQLVKASVYDPDHSLNNILVDANKKSWRTDFEIAQCPVLPGLALKAYGHMLGRLLSSYTFAFQPDMLRVSRFAHQLLAVLQPPAGARSEGSRILQHYLDEQSSKIGISSCPAVAW